MPELPDVETFKRYLDSTALHQSIAAVHVQVPALLDRTSASGLGRRLHGRRFERTHRHGKFLFVHAGGNGWLVLHFGMTGWLAYGKRANRPEYTDMVIEFKGGYELAYVAPRKLGRIGLAEEPQEVIDKEQLGPDALSLGFEQYRQLAAGRRGGVKCWLMNQQVMAGIGNIYSDEILFQARIHPKRALNDLDERRLQGLFKAQHDVLGRAIEAQADPERMPKGFLLPHRETGGQCPRCGDIVRSLKACGRTSWYCRRCQQ